MTHVLTRRRWLHCRLSAFAFAFFLALCSSTWRWVPQVFSVGSTGSSSSSNITSTSNNHKMEKKERKERKRRIATSRIWLPGGGFCSFCCLCFYLSRPRFNLGILLYIFIYLFIYSMLPIIRSVSHPPPRTSSLGSYSA